MNGHVFQLQVERKKKGQFQDTVDQLLVYASSAYVKEIKHLKPLFTQLELPSIVQPEALKSEDVVEQALFLEAIKQHFKDKKI